MLSMPNQRMSSCSSGATFVGVPSHSDTSQALRRAGALAGPVNRPGYLGGFPDTQG